MLLLPNIIYQFAVAPQHRHPADPEADAAVPEPGGPNSLNDLDDIDGAPHLADLEEYFSDGNEEGPDDNEIQEFEREEYMGQHPNRQPLSDSRLNAWSFFSTTFPTGLSSFWTEIKLALDPRTPPIDLESYAPRYRYLPIISGMIIPLSILLEIPGLKADWYIRTEANKTIETKPNTVILDTGLAISMLFGVLANICLVGRFMEMRVKYMTILCIILLAVHDLINITAVTVFGVEHRFGDGFTFGQGFWMTVCSTSVSAFTNITLIIDLIRTPQFATSGSGLTRKQRSLVISVMVMMSYIAFGALVQVFLMHLTFLDALYFTVVTIETIGFGDIYPVSTSARIFTAVYAVFGIINLALTVSLARETILEGIEVGYRRRIKAVHRHRKTIHRERRIFRRWRAAVDFRLHHLGQPIWVDDPVHHRSFFGHCFDKIWPWPKGNGRYNSSLGYGDHPHPHGMHLNLEALSWHHLETAAMEAGAPLRTLLPPGFESNMSFPAPAVFDKFDCEIRFSLSPSPDIPLTHARPGRTVAMSGSFGVTVNHSQFSKVPKQTRPPPIQMGTAKYIPSKEPVPGHFEAVKVAMEKEEKRAFYVRLCAVWIMFLLFWTVGSGIFAVTEKWSYSISLYFCFMSFTVAYGDLYPQTPAGRCVFVVWSLLGFGTTTILIAILSEAYSSRYERAFNSNLFSRVLKRHRERTLEEETAERKRPNPSAAREEMVNSPIMIHEAVEDSRRRAERRLAALPQELRRHARSLNENAKYLMSEPGVIGLSGTDMPDGLKQVINDVADVEKLGEGIKKEILKDRGARNTLLAISIEQALKTMVDIAEEAIDAMKERDRLIKLRSATVDSDVTIAQVWSPHTSESEKTLAR